MTVLLERGPGKTACPSEVARHLSNTESQWRELMPRVRETADDLAQQGKIDVLQKGKKIDSAKSAVGPIRLRIK